MRNALAAAALILLAAGCGAYHFPGDSTSPSPDSAHISGTVLSVPCAPVEQVGSTCAGRPVPKLEIDYLVGTTIVKRAVTDSKGTYAVDLKVPGTYAVKLNTYMRVISGATKLELVAPGNLVVTYMLDNGIRLPVPQQ